MLCVTKWGQKDEVVKVTRDRGDLRSWGSERIKVTGEPVYIMYGSILEREVWPYREINAHEYTYMHMYTRTLYACVSDQKDSYMHAISMLGNLFSISRSYNNPLGN